MDSVPNSSRHWHPFLTPNPNPNPNPNQQIDVPDPAKERRIIDCAASYVDCVRYPELYAPCGCPAAGGGGATATAAELRAKKLLRRLLAWW